MTGFGKFLLAALSALTCIQTLAAGPLTYTSLNFDLEYSSAYGPWMRVFQNQQEWDQFYQSLPVLYFELGKPIVHPPTPVIDFINNTLIVGGPGGVTATYFAIGSVYEADDGLYITAHKISPGPTCITIQSETNPTRYLLVPKTSKPVKAGMLQSIYPCAPL